MKILMVNSVKTIRSKHKCMQSSLFLILVKKQTLPSVFLRTELARNFFQFFFHKRIEFVSNIPVTDVESAFLKWIPQLIKLN